LVVENIGGLNMKRIVLLFLVIFVFTAMQAAAQTAVIKEITGTVELQTSAGGEWIPAKTGDVIQKATIVSTGFRSTAIITVGSSNITVRALTRLALEEIIILNETETVNLNLSSGRLKVDVNPPAGTRADFTVTSPSSTASVRGTSFEMDTVSIRVVSGAVSYAPATVAARPVTVSSGNESLINTDTGKAEPPMVIAQVTRAPTSLPGQVEDVVVVENAPVLHSGGANINIKLGIK
jgi:hypothetical protein